MTLLRVEALLATSGYSLPTVDPRRKPRVHPESDARPLQGSNPPPPRAFTLWSAASDTTADAVAQFGSRGVPWTEKAFLSARCAWVACDLLRKKLSGI